MPKRTLTDSARPRNSSKTRTNVSCSRAGLPLRGQRAPSSEMENELADFEHVISLGIRRVRETACFEQEGKDRERHSRPAAHRRTLATTRGMTTQIRLKDRTEKSSAPGTCATLSFITPHWPHIAPSPYHAVYGQNSFIPPCRSQHAVYVFDLRVSRVWSNRTRLRI
jgi:hypothetical protein